MKQITILKLKENRTIKNLKKVLVRTHKEYHKKIYETLSRIYNLRKKEYPEYTIMDLSNESTIKDLFPYDYINTIMQIRKITPKVRKVIENDGITTFEVANLLRRSRALQNPKKQDKFFSDISELTKNEIRNNVTVFNSHIKKNMSEENAWILQTVYEIRTVKKYIEQRFNKLIPLNKTKVVKEVRELYDFISGKKVKEYSLVPISKESIKLTREVKIKGLYSQEKRKIIETIIELFCTNGMAKCKGCRISFKKNRKDQVFHSPKCKNKYNNKK
jgi:hypothetical protein|tara:strand:+ start:592 stop:1413 length:822 start_codon:yes stop_codon:yes gene_type:complete